MRALSKRSPSTRRAGGVSPGHVDRHRQAGSIAERACGVTAAGGILHQAGKSADLVVVEGDPLQNIAVLQDHQRMKLVFKEGQLCVDRRVSPAVLPLAQPGVRA